MKLKQLLNDDDAVSPVIGVILMVAITVILAAVIASFVLGLGDQADEVQPNSNFEFDYTNNTGGTDELAITLTDGDTIEKSNLYLRGNANGDIDTDWEFSSLNPSGVSANGTGGFDTGSSTELTSGQGVELTVGSGDGDFTDYDLSVVWETSSDSATLASDEGPDA